MEIKAHIDEDSLELENDNLYSVIYIEIDELNFPESKWTDFLVVILSWWLEEIIGYTKGQKTKLEFQFMDGPFSLEMDLIHLKWVISLTHKEKTKEFSASKRDVLKFFESILKITELTFEKISELKVYNNDIELLRKNYEECKDSLTYFLEKKF